MRTRLTRGVSRYCRVLFLLFLGHVGLAVSQSPPTQFGEERLPWLVMVGRPDPADPSRYIGVHGDDLSNAVAVFRDGIRLRPTVPQMLQHGDEMEMGRDVVGVMRYPIGDVYIDAATRVRVGSLDVLFGRIFARVRGLFSVENQSVVAGVEGTEFAFEVAADGTTQITVLDGIVLSSSKNLPWKPLRVTRGQAFTVTDSGRQMRIGAAPPATLAQLRTWTQRVDNAVAVLAPREPQARPQPQPQPEPQPQPQPQVQPQPQPQPQPPFVLQPQPQPQPQLPPIILPPFPHAVQSGYCCDAAGRVYRSTLEGCRGGLYESHAEASRRCERRQEGYCCANGRVFESAPQQCRGVFSYDLARVREGCAAPPPAGYCCAGGQVTAATRNQCRGNFFTDEGSARKACTAPPPPTGYCCAGGEISRVNRAQCRGNYFTDEASARKACTAPPSPMGYCCAGGKVSQTTQAGCNGVFKRAQAEAQHACRVVRVEPKPDAVLKDRILKKAPDGPVVR